MSGALDQWPDVKRAAIADGWPGAVSVVQLALDNGYEPSPPLCWRAAAGQPSIELRVETSRQGIERLVLVIGTKSYTAKAYRKVARDGRTSQSRTVYVADELYEAACRLGPWADVARAAIEEYVRSRA